MRDGVPAHTFRVQEPRRCYVCDERMKEQEAHSKKGNVIRPEALVWYVEQVD
ncbi:hypothetical protein ACIBEJ_35095 [Nonomuraea sp. NPDC050790]|uniref:hypothetical protein n=1 Tax=Nonomuraea sp. NPDC050790 TaxID=3364371 RepID=UPI0037A7DD11